MTRDEEIIQASDEWTYQKPPQYSELVYNTHKAMCAYQVGFIDGAVWADRHPHWISVEDELPEENKWVLTYNGTSINLLMLAGNGGWYDHSVVKHLNITHWMQLPEQPKKGGKQ